MPVGLQAVRLLARLTSWLFPAAFRREYGSGFVDVAEHRWRRETAHSSAARATLTTTRLLIRDAVAAAGPWWMSAVETPARRLTRLGRTVGSWAGGGWSDLRFAGRTVARRPAFSLLVVVTLGVGIGASSAGFDALDRAVLHPLPFAHADRLVFLKMREVHRGFLFAPSAALLRRWRAGARSLEQIEGFGSELATDVAQGGAVEVNVLTISGGLPAMLGVRPVIGRMLGPADGEPAAPPAVMLSEQYWRRAFGADRHVIGRTLPLAPVPATIVGIWPSGARLEARTVPDLIEVPPPGSDTTGGAYFNVLARRAPGRSPADVQRELAALAAHAPSAPGWEAQPLVTGFDTLFLGPEFVACAWLAFAGALALYLAAVSNACHLLISRALGREQELRLRLALGGSRSRVARLFLAEAVAYGAGAALASLALTCVLEWLVEHDDPQVFAPVTGAGLGGRALLFAVLAAATATIVCAVAPLARRSGSSRVSLTAMSAAHSTARRSRVLSTLVGAQAALAVMLLFGAALMTRSVRGLLRVDTGVAIDHLATFSVLPGGTQASRRVLVGRIHDALGDLPGVVGVTTSNAPLLSATVSMGPIALDGVPVALPASGPGVAMLTATPNYFDVLGIPLLSGRAFRDGEAGVAIVNEAFARAAGSVLGRRLQVGQSSPLPVVGVAANTSVFALTDDQPQLTVYSPASDRPYDRFILRTSGDPAGVLRDVRTLVARIDPTVPVIDAQTGDQVAAEQTALNRLVATVLDGLALLGAVLAVSGIYSAVVVAVTRRTREIGVRLALGATSGRVVREAIRDALRPVLVGAALGSIAGALAASRLDVLLFHVSPHDPISGVASAGLILAAATAAAWVAARAVARIDPASTLRAT